ncbi:MAG TPA: aminotransferase class V-fold PLP-dependent enzyme [Vicinamibacteria bacterium]
MNEPLTKSIHALETRARELEPSAEVRQALLRDVSAYAEEFLSKLPDLPAYLETEDRGIGLLDTPVGEEPRPLSLLLEHLRRDVDRPGLNPASGGHLGYIPGGGLYASSLGDYLAAVTNRYSGVFFASPGAVRMENMLLDWMSGLVGYPRSTAGGNLTSGGSIANLMGVVAARDAHGIRSRDVERAVIYATEQAHHSVTKAIRIAGLADAVERLVPLDERYRMRAQALERAIESDRANGRIPFLVIASAGTTDTGVVDPIEDIAVICGKENLWLHVDGAYGGFFVLCEPGRKALGRLDGSDSLVMDPHKTLFLPYGSGAVLVRDRTKLLESHHYTANYMQDALRARDELSPADLSPELTKHFRGLRLWMPLLLHGLAPFRAALEEKVLLARYFHERLSERPGFEVGPYPDLSVVIFRYRPAHGDADAFNQKLVEAIHEDGRVFLTSTILDGRFTLRLAVVSFRVHLETIDLALEILDREVRRLEAV